MLLVVYFDPTRENRSIKIIRDSVSLVTRIIHSLISPVPYTDGQNAFTVTLLSSKNQSRLSILNFDLSKDLKG